MTDTTEKSMYRVTDMHTNPESEIDRLRAQALWAWDKEFRNLTWFGLRDGVSILELGSGPGFITEQLLTALPNCTVTCLEIDPDLIARATAYLGDRFAGRCRIVEGDVMSMSFDSNTFDFALARLIMQHLPNPGAAIAETYRVLKPGGVFAVTDVDDDFNNIIDPPSPQADAIVDKMREPQSQPSSDRKIGRRLWRMLAAGGFGDLDLEAVLIHTDKLGIEALIPSEWDPGAYEPLVRRGILTEEDVEILRVEHEKFHASPDKYAMFAALMGRGRKPETA